MSILYSEANERASEINMRRQALRPNNLTDLFIKFETKKINKFELMELFHYLFSSRLIHEMGPRYAQQGYILNEIGWVKF